MPRRQLAGLRVLVTGGSSGIGKELCLLLASQGAHVLTTARRSDRLESLQRECDGYSGTLNTLSGDINMPLHRSAILTWVRENWGALDVLVNNAGAGAIGLFEDATDGRLRLIMEVNFFSPVELTRLCLPLLRKGRRPAILNIGSVLAHRAVPLKSEYCAAKFALRGWNESLRVELANEKIDVLMLSPSTTRSEFFDALLETDSNLKSRSLGSMTAKQVAESALRAIVQSKRELILSWGGRFLVWAGRFFPNTTDRILGRFGMPKSNA